MILEVLKKLEHERNNAIDYICGYFWETEKRHFEEFFEVTIGSNDSVSEWVIHCEEEAAQGRPAKMQHVFYKLMVIRLTISLKTANEPLHCY